jgi:hypothetical protein
MANGQMVTVLPAISNLQENFSHHVFHFAIPERLRFTSLADHL